MALNKNVKVFMMHVTFLLIIAIYPAKESQIASLFAKKIKILVKYLDFLNMFLKKEGLGTTKVN